MNRLFTRIGRGVHPARERSSGGVPEGAIAPRPSTPSEGGKTKDVVDSVPRDPSGSTVYYTRARAGHARAGHGNLLYYWFAPSTVTANEHTPLIIWLNGGPGVSSLLGLFWENGPFTLDEHGVVHVSAYGWNQNAHVLYWDNPVGTGYSYNENGDPHAYVKDEREMATQLVNALQQFYEAHPEYVCNPLYVCGESYAGKYIPYVAMEITYRNLVGTGRPIPLRGTVIGDGLVDPLNQVHDEIAYASMLGMVDDLQRQKAEKLWREIAKDVERGEYVDALNKGNLLEGMLVSCGGGEYVYDVRSFGNLDLAPLSRYLNSDAVKRCFNVPASVTWECADDSGPVGDALAARIILPVCDLIPLLVDFPATADAIIAWHDGAGTQAHRRPATEPYQMLFYTGMFDMSCGFAGTDRMLRSMRWRGQDTWAHAVRGVWYTEGDVGARGEPARLTQGCVKHVENLTQIEIPQAGHMVPLDQPRIARNMIYRFIWGTGFPSYDPLAR